MKSKFYYLIIFLISLLLFVPFLGRVHLFDWDEINFAEMAREMIVTGDYGSLTINFQPFYEKPPIYIWFNAISMHLFGVNEFSARLPNAVAGILSLLFLFKIGKEYKDEKFALIWVGAYASSFLPSFYFKSGIIDPWFNLFIFSSLWYAYKYQTQRLWKYLAYSGILASLSVLTKGQVGVLLGGYSFIIWLAIQRGWGFVYLTKENWKAIFQWSFFLLPAIGLWMSFEFIANDGKFIHEFIIYQIRLLSTPDAGHGGPFFYHFVVLLIGCFPVSVFALLHWKKHWSEKSFPLLMMLLLGTVLLIFSIVNTKIVHYSSLAYYPLTFLAAYSIYQAWYSEMKLPKFSVILTLIIGSLIGFAISIVPFVGANLDLIIPYVKDPFAVENMKANLNWDWWQGIGGMILLSALMLFKYQLDRSRVQKAFVILGVSTILCIQWTMLTVVPNIEGISQRAAIEFYKSLEKEDCYIEVLGYKSYAHLFYTKKQDISRTEALDVEWLLKGDIDKDAYFVTKVHLAAKYMDIPQLEVIGRQNGFVFLKRSVN